MPKSSFSIPHTLPADEAKGRLEKFADALRSKFQDQVSDLDNSWEGDTLTFGFKTFGIKIKGNIEVRESELAVDYELPFAAMAFKGKIESEMREQLGRLIG